MPQCNENSFVTRSIVNILPAWFRFAQCLRRYRDSGDAFPHLVNAGKYSTTFFVVILSTVQRATAGKHKTDHFYTHNVSLKLSELISPAD